MSVYPQKVAITTSEGPVFLSPGDLCRRWSVDWKTLNKFPIPWVHLSPTVRRIDLAFVLTYEETNRLLSS